MLILLPILYMLLLILTLYSNHNYINTRIIRINSNINIKIIRSRTNVNISITRTNVNTKITRKY